jgi:hypothetical protein
MIKTLILMLAVCVLAGCATTPPEPTPAQVAAAVFPPKPDYRKAALAYFQWALRDPESARYSCWMLSKAWRPTPQGGEYGWAVSVLVNAKNGYGGYTGDDFYALWIGPDGRAVNAVEHTLGVKILQAVPTE